MNPEAVEAAAKAIWDASGHKPGDWVYMAPETERPQRYRAYATAALEAAAPYLVREARAAELEAAADDITESAQIIAVRSHDTGVDNGQTLHAMTTDSDWLRARAATIRNGQS